MAKKAHEVSFAVAGKIGDLVYQRVRKGKGNIQTSGKYDLQLRRQGAIIDARTPAQILTRDRMAAATAAYQALDQAARDTWRKKAANARATGYNLFVKEYCKAHPLPEVP